METRGGYKALGEGILKERKRAESLGSQVWAYHEEDDQSSALHITRMLSSYCSLLWNAPFGYMIEHSICWLHYLRLLVTHF